MPLCEANDCTNDVEDWGSYCPRCCLPTREELAAEPSHELEEALHDIDGARTALASVVPSVAGESLVEHAYRVAYFVQMLMSWPM